MSKQLPDSAQVVIVGGGVIGCSIAYHLTKLGWSDVILLERKQLTCGTTWHAAGLVTSLRSTENMTQLAKYTQDLYRNLEQETGQATGFSQIGSINLACSKQRQEELRRECSMARCFGVETHELSAAQVQEMWPLMDVSDVLTGFYFPTDGRTNPTDTSQALAKGARMGGAKIFENTLVTGITKDNGRVTGVTTEQGEIKAEYVVNCSGMWARELGLMAGVDVPLHAAEHYYLITESMEGLSPEAPIIKDVPRYSYYREEAGKLMLGFFEPVAAPWAMDGIPKEFCFDDLPPDWDRMIPYIEQGMKRIPAMENAGIQLLFNGPESFTPDDEYWMGEHNDLKNFFVAAGFNSRGVLSAGGVGMVMAHWIVEGRPPMDVWDTMMGRVEQFQNNKRYLKDRTVEVLGYPYQPHWPFRTFETARDIRKSPVHDRLAKAGACFSERMGWERPNWFAPEGVEPIEQHAWGRSNWFEYNAEEHRAVREKVGLFDYSSYAKYLVQGRDSEKVLNRICTNNMAVPVGKVVYTLLLNEQGTIEGDVTVTRFAEDCFMIVSAAFTRSHVANWLKINTPDDAHCFITDVTSGYSILSIQGPDSRALLTDLTDDAKTAEQLSFSNSQIMDIGYARPRVQRLTFMGELGYELIIPTEFAVHVYDAIIEAGEKYGLRHCGFHVMESLRIEKAYREYSLELTADYTPLEAGLGFVCKFDKEDGFIGQEAVQKQKGEGMLKRRIVQFLLEDPEPLLYHNEPIFRDGILVGHTSSAFFGHTLGGAVALGYVNCEEGVTGAYIEEGTFEIEVANVRYSAKASLKPMYDPTNQRITS